MKREYIDLIDFNTPERYSLSIRLASDGFCFSLCDHNDSDKLFTFPYRTDPVMSELANVKNAVDDFADLSDCSFRKVSVLLCSERCLAVPASLFDEDNVDNMYCQVFERHVEEDILCNYSEDKKIVYLFSVNKYVKRFIDSVFPNAVYYNSANVFSIYCHLKCSDAAENSLSAYVSGELLEICAYDKSGLLYFNVFCCDNDSDRFYYIINVWSKLELSQLDDRIYLMSDCNKSQALKKMLERYLHKIYIIPSVDDVNLKNAECLVSTNFDLQSLSYMNKRFR